MPEIDSTPPNNIRDYKYKRTKCFVPVCNVCGEELGGNGSGFMPWKCKCGVWKYDWYLKHYYVVPEDKKGGEEHT